LVAIRDCSPLYWSCLLAASVLVADVRPCRTPHPVAFGALVAGVLPPMLLIR
jgi:hypothetical protein